MCELAEKKEELRKIGVPLILIGNGNSNFAKAFIEDSQFVDEWRDAASPWKVEIYVDTKLAAYSAFELRRGLLSVLAPWNFRTMMKAKSKYKISNGELQGDGTQQGGTFIIGPGDSLYYSYPNNNLGDHAPMDEVLAILGQ
jgi:hypothetical protein